MYLMSKKSTDPYDTFQETAWLYFPVRWIYEPIIMFFSKNYVVHSLKSDEFPEKGLTPTCHKKSECRLFCNNRPNNYEAFLRLLIISQTSNFWLINEINETEEIEEPHPVPAAINWFPGLLIVIPGPNLIREISTPFKRLFSPLVGL